MNSKQDKLKEIPSKSLKFQLSKLKDKESILKAAREKRVPTYSIRLTADFSRETMESRR